MKKHIEEALDWFGENITERPVNSANKNLFNVEPGSEELDTGKSDISHSGAAKLLYVCKRARPDV